MALQGESELAAGERIFLMPDYSADPVWAESDGAMLPIGDLGLSEAALLGLHMWADWFERTEPRRDQQSTRLRYFNTEWEERAYCQAGVRLWRLVREELAGRYEVGLALRHPKAKRVWSEEELGALDLDQEIVNPPPLELSR